MLFRSRGVGPDLVVTMQPDSNMVEKYLLDISDTKASTAYDGTVMNASKLDGKTYLIPLPGVYSGYVVNETMFERAGLPFPTSNENLVDSLSRLKEKGIGIGEDDINFSIMSDYNTSVGMFYVGCMVPDFLGTVEQPFPVWSPSGKRRTFFGRLSGSGCSRCGHR